MLCKNVNKELNLHESDKKSDNEFDDESDGEKM